jgi:hypothetical protein
LPVVAVVAGLVLLSLSLVLLGLTRVREGRVSPLFAVLPLGAWPLAISPVWWMAQRELLEDQRLPLFGTLWNFANGLESAVLLAAFAAVVWFYVQRPIETRFRAVVFGWLLGALSLARLDHAVFALAIAGLPVGYHLVGVTPFALGSTCGRCAVGSPCCSYTSPTTLQPSAEPCR